MTATDAAMRATDALGAWRRLRPTRAEHYEKLDNNMCANSVELMRRAPEHTELSSVGCCCELYFHRVRTTHIGERSLTASCQNRAVPHMLGRNWLDAIILGMRVVACNVSPAPRACRALAQVCATDID